MIRVTEEEVSHVKVLLAHIEACSDVERSIVKTSRAYDTLLNWQAGHILKSFAPAYEFDSITVADRVFEVIHATCKAVGIRFNLDNVYETDLTNIVVTATKISTYRRRILDAVADMQKPDASCLTKQDIIDAQAKRRASGNSILRVYMMRAVWKQCLGKELSVLDAVIIDRPTLSLLRVDCQSFMGLMKRATDSIAALDNKWLCRACLSKARRKPNTLACDVCERVFFCSIGCKQTSEFDKSTGHAANECNLLI